MSHQYEQLKQDLDFFENVYKYFTRGGFSCIIVENIMNIFIIVITLLFFIFTCFCLDWGAISECTSESTCHDLQQYVISPTTFNDLSLNIFMFTLIITFIIDLSFKSIALIRDIIKFKKYKLFFKEELNISSNELKALSWVDVVNKLINRDSQLSAEIIVGSIMRKENYLIAIVSSNILGYNINYYTKNFLSLIKIGIIDRIFDGNNRTHYININYPKIKSELQFMVIYHTIMIILKLIDVFIDFIIELTTDIYVNGSYDRLRDWNIYAKLLFREYNELPHIFNERLIKSYMYAIKYEQKFNVQMTNLIIRKITFVFGLCLTFLVLLMIYDDRLLSYITLGDRNLFWYASILISCIYFTNILMVHSSTIDESAEEILEKIIKYIHYNPDAWRERYNKHEIFNEFKQLFKYKFQNTFYEICSIFVIPYYSYKKSSRDLELIAKFIQANTIHKEGIGCVCKFSIDNVNNIREVKVETEETEQHVTLVVDDYSQIKEPENYSQIEEIDHKIERSISNFKKYYLE